MPIYRTQTIQRIGSGSTSKAQSDLWGFRILIACTLIWMLGFIVGFQRSIMLITTLGIVASLVGFSRPTIGIYGVSILCTIDALTRVFVMTGGLFRWNTVNYIMLLMIGLGFRILISMCRIDLIRDGFITERCQARYS